MAEPAVALLVVGGAMAAAVILLWPVHGLLWRAVRALRATGRVRIEDALKHIYDCEYHNIPCTLNSVSGALGISGNRTASLLARLEALKLVKRSWGGYELTPQGRGDALRVLRVHRLWERYLAERTNLGADEWHEEAEYREHQISPEQADRLAAQMGHPRFDPHGDPIPISTGEVSGARGMPLTDLAPGRLAAIVHIEDEPTAVYAQIVAESLLPDMRVLVLESGPERVRFEADGEEVVLAPVVAANLTVVPLAEDEEMAGPFEPLSSLTPGERARVVGISRKCRGPERRRLLDLGVIPGTVIEAEMRAPGGDPVGYRIRGALIALRHEQADLIHVDRQMRETAA